MDGVNELGEGGRERERDGSKPGDEEDLALLTVIGIDEVKIQDSIAAVIVRQVGGEAFMALTRATNFVNLDRLSLLIDLVHNVPRFFLPLHIHERALAFVQNFHPCRGLHQNNQHPKNTFMKQRQLKDSEELTQDQA